MTRVPRFQRLGEVLRGDAGGGILLLLAALLGMAAANSPAVLCLIPLQESIEAEN